MTHSLGRLEPVDLRVGWESEAHGFTPWLAGAENLEILGETIKMDLEIEAQEKNVGPFRADILCKDTATDNWVLIENQLERTDHVHLGQLLTYAAGLNAVTIVWVAAQFTEEHRATLDWLNEITDERFQFFGLEVELWRIGDSKPAPKFNIISKPNDWSRSVERAARRIASEPMSETQERYVRFWSAFKEYLIERGSLVRPVKPQPANWTQYGIGRTGFALLASFNTQKGSITASLYIPAGDAKGYFHQLKADREAIERDFGEPLRWDELPNRKGSAIGIDRYEVDFEDETQWPEQHCWLAERLERLDRTFRQRVRKLDTGGRPPDAESAAE